MSDIMLVDGDISIDTVRGDIMTISGDDEILQYAINNIMTIYGSNQFNPTVGNIALTKRHKMTESDLVSIASDCKNAIMIDNRVRYVDNITATKSNDVYGACNIQFAIITMNNVRVSSSILINVGGE